jgi:hypothetical protein
MTDQNAGDASQVEPLLNEIDRPTSQFTADGAYDGEPIYDAVGRHSADAVVVIPPRSNAIDSSQTGIASQRDRHIEAIKADGRMKWQATTGYGKRSLVETAIGRYKSIIGHRLGARSFGAQQTEVAIGCAPSIACWHALARIPSAAKQQRYSVCFKDRKPFPL